MSHYLFNEFNEVSRAGFDNHQKYVDTMVQHEVALKSKKIFLNYYTINYKDESSSNYCNWQLLLNVPPQPHCPWIVFDHPHPPATYNCRCCKKINTREQRRKKRKKKENFFYFLKSTPPTAHCFTFNTQQSCLKSPLVRRFLAVSLRCQLRAWFSVVRMISIKNYLLQPIMVRVRTIQQPNKNGSKCATGSTCATSLPMLLTGIMAAFLATMTFWAVDYKLCHIYNDCDTSHNHTTIGPYQVVVGGGGTAMQAKSTGRICLTSAI